MKKPQSKDFKSRNIYIVNPLYRELKELAKKHDKTIVNFIRASILYTDQNYTKVLDRKYSSLYRTPVKARSPENEKLCIELGIPFVKTTRLPLEPLELYITLERICKDVVDLEKDLKGVDIFDNNQFKLAKVLEPMIEYMLEKASIKEILELISKLEQAYCKTSGLTLETPKTTSDIATTTTPVEEESNPLQGFTNFEEFSGNLPKELAIMADFTKDWANSVLNSYINNKRTVVEFDGVCGDIVIKSTPKTFVFYSKDNRENEVVIEKGNLSMSDQREIVLNAMQLLYTSSKEREESKSREIAEINSKLENLTKEQNELISKLNELTK